MSGAHTQLALEQIDGVTVDPAGVTLAGAEATLEGFTVYRTSACTAACALVTIVFGAITQPEPMTPTPHAVPATRTTDELALRTAGDAPAPPSGLAIAPGEVAKLGSGLIL